MIVDTLHILYVSVCGFFKCGCVRASVGVRSSAVVHSPSPHAIRQILNMRNGIVILVFNLIKFHEGVKSSPGSSTPQIELPVSKFRNAVID